MQKQQTIDFSKFCGRDEDGDSKAICTLQVASVDTETGDIKEIDAVSIQNPSSFQISYQSLRYLSLYL